MLEVFTSQDDRFVLEGSRDGFGVLPLWTGLGQAIFGNRLTSVAYDVRLYTVTFIFASWAHEFLNHNISRWQGLVGESCEWRSRDELLLGVIMCMENILALGLSEVQKAGEVNVMSVPGIGNAAGYSENGLFILKPSLESEHLLLKGQSGLGVLGRHKGPLIHMNLLDSRLRISHEAQNCFHTALASWDNLVKLKRVMFSLMAILLSDGRDWKNIKKKYSKLPMLLYECFGLTDKIPTQVRRAWKKKLKLNSGAAGLLYDVVPRSIEVLDYADIFKKAYRQVGAANEDKRLLNNVIKLEPLLSLSSMAFALLLYAEAKCVSDIEKELELVGKRIRSEVTKNEVVQLVKEQKQMERLLLLGKVRSPFALAREIASQHEEIMRHRGRLLWVDVKEDGTIVHSGPVYSGKPSLLEQLTSGGAVPWTHGYYLDSLHGIALSIEGGAE